MGNGNNEIERKSIKTEFNSFPGALRLDVAQSADLVIDIKLEFSMDKESINESICRDQFHGTWKRRGLGELVDQK